MNYNSSDRVLPASGCSPMFSPAPPWQQLTPVGGFVSGVQWLMHGYGSTLIAERLIGTRGQKNKVTVYFICAEQITYEEKKLSCTFQIQGFEDVLKNLSQTLILLVTKCSLDAKAFLLPDK